MFLSSRNLYKTQILFFKKSCLLSNRNLSRLGLTNIITSKKPKLLKAENVFDLIFESNSKIFIQMAVNTPEHLNNTLCKVAREKNLKNIKLYQLLTTGSTNWAQAHKDLNLRSDNFFVSSVNRDLVNDGLADYTPIFLSDVPRLFKNNFLNVDIVLTQVSPADKHGYHSFGPTIVAINEIMLKSKFIVCQVNQNIPRTFGDSLIHESNIDYIVEHNDILNQYPQKKLNENEIKIGKLIAENLIENGSTLQVGIGNLPDAVLKYCLNHKNLGIHSEMISDAIIDLIYSGAVTNHLKKNCKGKTVASFGLGTNEKMYKFLHDNPSVLMKSCLFVNNEEIISQNPKVAAINTCIEIDLKGQVCSDSIGPKTFSGFGGQVDFLRGASLSKDGLGKPILALNSTTNKGESKIVACFKPNSSIVASRAHVHYVVTEYGIANLFGKNLRRRAYELIKIAHPKFCENLEKAAFDQLGCLPSND